jgi:hypothetical protein
MSGDDRPDFPPNPEGWPWPVIVWLVFQLFAIPLVFLAHLGIRRPLDFYLTDFFAPLLFGFIIFLLWLCAKRNYRFVVLVRVYLVLEILTDLFYIFDGDQLGRWLFALLEVDPNVRPSPG